MTAMQLNKGGSNGYIYISTWYLGSYWSSLSFASNNWYNQRQINDDSKTKYTTEFKRNYETYTHKHFKYKGYYIPAL